MRISSAASQFGITPINKTTRTEAAGKATASSESQSPFSVQLTNLVSSLFETQPSSGEIRPEKVEDISRRLAEGSYNISGQAVATKILAVLQA